MTTEEMQLLFEQLVKSYFAGASVRWCETNQVKPPYPLVALKLTNVSRSVHPDTYGEEEVCRCYLCTGSLTLNLYTQGRCLPAQPGLTAPPARNTAVGDLQAFLCYLDSDAGQDFQSAHNLCILPEGKTQDVTALLNDNAFEYRALQEFSVEFVDKAFGHAGVTPPSGEDFEQTPSGGGTPEQAQDKTGWFERAKVTYQKEAENE